MIGQIDSEADSQVQNQYQAPTPKFQARMGLVEARITVLTALKSLTAGGYTRRVGIIAREVCGARFGKYQPPEIVNWLRSDDFQEKFEEELEKWKKNWNPASPAKAVRKRQIQYRACQRSITERWWENIADAIESMIASHAPQVVVADSAGNKRVQSLADVLDLMFFIPMTPYRSGRMRVLGVGKTVIEE